MSPNSNNWSERIYFIANEAKDIYCLTPLASLIDRKIYSLNSLSKSDIADILFADKPIFVCASHIALIFLEAIRPRDSFIAVGIEHGLAPFKGYTFSERLLDYNVYCAPTEAWAERLRKLYPGKANRVVTTGYPRLETLKALREIIRNAEYSNNDEYQSSDSTENRNILVVLSWGVHPDSLKKLPDLPNIVYLAHPADSHLTGAVNFEKSRLLISSPAIASRLLARADIVYGDFSSMTIESEVLGLPVKMFLCRDLYKSDCDLGNSFFEPSAENYAKAPHHTGQIDERNVIGDLPSLIDSLTKSATDKKDNEKVRIFPKDFSPPMESAVKLCVAVLNNLAVKIETGAHHLTTVSVDETRNISVALEFLISAYHTILGRAPDGNGIRTYMNDFRASKDPGPLWSLKVLREFAYSKEGQNRWQDSPKRLTTVHFLN
ncbi:hypothetical protein [Massilia timonae]|uniref:hypothetical protein n=1 Tax=Massilia timonae TaxID=47229 RepID=UPI0028AC04EE|nr:hypothetical protein [Massilia timonae]